MSKQGFTLIELMIVVAIIGILAAIAVPKFSLMISKAKDAQTMGNLGVLRSAIASYYADTEGWYPAFPPPFSQPSGYGSLLADSITPNHISEIPEARPSGSKHVASNWVDNVWNQTGSEDNEPIKGRGWKYDANPFDKDWGTIKVLCTHQDAKGTNWSVY